MAIKITVAGVDRTDQIDWKSVEKIEVLTKEPDSLRFLIKNYDSKTFRPSIGDEVVITDEPEAGAGLFDLLAVQGVTHPFLTESSKVFGGVVVDTRDAIVGKLRFFEVRCKDFTHTLDRQLVVKIFTSTSADDIIADIVDNFVEAGFTVTNVDAPTIVQKIIFNYLTVSQSLQSLAETLGDHDWFVDYEKDINFFKTEEILSPFNLTDTSGNFIWNSLVVEANNHQLRNHIFIRGGDIEGDLVTNVQKTDGEQRVVFVGYSLSVASLLIEKALAASPTTFVTLTVGRDGVDNAASFDCLYNPNDGLIIFPEATKPAVDDRIKSEGFPIFPLIADKIDLDSVAVHGEFQHLIVDKTIRSRESASQRAGGELLKYASVANEASFKTNKSGLRTGQTININSTIRSINQDFRIQRITTTLRTPSTFTHRVSLLASEDVTMVDVLNRLLVTSVTDQIEIKENEVLNRLISKTEAFTIGEAFTLAQGGDPLHNPQTETITLGEVDIEQPLDFGTLFVVGPFIPTISFDGDEKRPFIVGGSHISEKEKGLFDALAIQGVTHPV